MVSLPFEVHSHRGGRNSAWSMRVRSLYLISGVMAIARLLMSVMDVRMLATVGESCATEDVDNGCRKGAGSG